MLPGIALDGACRFAGCGASTLAFGLAEPESLGVIALGACSVDNVACSGPHDPRFRLTMSVCLPRCTSIATIVALFPTRRAFESSTLSPETLFPSIESTMSPSLSAPELCADMRGCRAPTRTVPRISTSSSIPTERQHKFTSAKAWAGAFSLRTLLQTLHQTGMPHTHLHTGLAICRSGLAPSSEPPPCSQQQRASGQSRYIALAPRPVFFADRPRARCSYHRPTASAGASRIPLGTPPARYDMG